MGAFRPHGALGVTANQTAIFTRRHRAKQHETIGFRAQLRCLAMTDGRLYLAPAHGGHLSRGG
jgi:hypothetical protein